MSVVGALEEKARAGGKQASSFSTASKIVPHRSRSFGWVNAQEGRNRTPELVHTLQRVPETASVSMIATHLEKLAKCQ